MTAYIPYILTVLVLLFLASAIRILREYQRGEVFTCLLYTSDAADDLLQV